MLSNTADDPRAQNLRFTRIAGARRSKRTVILQMQGDIERELAGPISPMQRASLISAWDKLEERLRILAGKPLPGSLTYEKRVSRRQEKRSLLSPLFELPSSDAGDQRQA